MQAGREGRYRAFCAETAEDLARARDLRWRAFRAGRAAAGGCDGDRFDALCRHVLVEERASGRLAAAFRLLPLARGAEIGRSYSAQHYDLSALSRYSGPMVEMGRFCLDPDLRDPDVLRLAWGWTTRLVAENRVGLLFGCASFAGTDAAPYLDAFALLRARHLAPRRWSPGVKAPRVFRFAGLRRRPDPTRASRVMPSLLRTYLAMGGWVSDHAVIDEDLGTLHVFTGLEVARVPAARARALRGVAEFCP